MVSGENIFIKVDAEMGEILLNEKNISSILVQGDNVYVYMVDEKFVYHFSKDEWKKARIGFLIQSKEAEA